MLQTNTKTQKCNRKVAQRYVVTFHKKINKTKQITDRQYQSKEFSASVEIRNIQIKATMNCYLIGIYFNLKMTSSKI